MDKNKWIKMDKTLLICSDCHAATRWVSTAGLLSALSSSVDCLKINCNGILIPFYNIDLIEQLKEMINEMPQM